MNSEENETDKFVENGSGGGGMSKKLKDQELQDQDDCSKFGSKQSSG
jgi:hypothetical protein